MIAAARSSSSGHSNPGRSAVEQRLVVERLAERAAVVGAVHDDVLDRRIWSRTLASSGTRMRRR